MAARLARGSLPPAAVWIAAVIAAVIGALAPTPWVQLGLMLTAVAICAWWGRIGAAALRLGFGAAAVFVVLRVLYRALFAPVLPPPATDHVLWALPTIPLGGPFAGIALFGAVTLEQLAATLSDASRFAVVFVVFGAANALADARTLLARAPIPVLPLATVLSLALGSVPALLTAAQRVAAAAKLRGERRSPYLIVPIFEQAVERATVLGASMELRGYRRTKLQRYEPPAVSESTSRVMPVPSAANPPLVQEILVAHALTVLVDTAGGGSRQIVRGIDLVLRAGEVTVVQGPTGSGKSTLLAALAGLVPQYTGGAITGSVTLRGMAPSSPAIHLCGPGIATRPAVSAGQVALVPQRVEHSFVAEQVRDELAFALQRHDISAAARDELLAAALHRFRLVHLADRELSTLSAGEATRVAIAAASLTRPRVLLLDEPVADLDPDSVRAVAELLLQHLRDGGTVLVAEHRPEMLGELLDQVPAHQYQLVDGTLHELDLLQQQEMASSALGAPARDHTGALPQVRPALTPGRNSVLSVENLSVERGGRALLTVPQLTLQTGEIVVLSGPNGSGKTSLCEELERSSTETVLVPHRVDDLLIRDSIDAECRFADRRAQVPRGTTAANFAALIAPPAVPPPPTTHPRDASAGTRLALGIALQLSRSPRVLLLDEPTRGLDATARARLADTCARLAAGGTALLIATHDAQFAQGLTQSVPYSRHLRIVDGTIV